MSLEAEFRESIQLTIPKIIALLNHRDDDILTAGVEALSKLSEKGRISRLMD